MGLEIVYKNANNESGVDLMGYALTSVLAKIKADTVVAGTSKTTMSMPEGSNLLLECRIVNAAGAEVVAAFGNSSNIAEVELEPVLTAGEEGAGPSSYAAKQAGLSRKVSVDDFGAGSYFSIESKGMCNDNVIIANDGGAVLPHSVRLSKTGGWKYKQYFQVQNT